MPEEIIIPETKIVVKAQEISFDITEMVKSAQLAKAFADNLEILNDKDMIMAIDALAEIKGEAKEGEEVRKKVIDQPNKYVKTINSYFKTPAEIFEEAVKKINLKLQFFRDAKRQLAEEKQAKELEAFRERQEAEKLEAARQKREERIVAPPKVMIEESVTVRTATSKATFIEFFDYEIVDLHKVYESHPELIKMDIKRADTLALLKITQNIPGLMIFKNSTTR
jgi:hypothetical protein